VAFASAIGAVGRFRCLLHVKAILGRMIISLAVATNADGAVFARMSLRVAVETGNYFCQLSLEAVHSLKLAFILSQISKKTQLFTRPCTESLIAILKVTLGVV
jgi:hypothetical protein